MRIYEKIMTNPPIHQKTKQTECASSRTQIRLDIQTDWSEFGHDYDKSMVIMVFKGQLCSDCVELGAQPDLNLR